MAIAHDTATRFPATNGPSGTNSVDTTTGSRTFSHAGSASAKGAVVMVCATGNTAVVTGVLYGGVAMTNQGSVLDTSEAGRIELFYLVGPTMPTGTQTVTLQGCTATGKWVTCSTVTAPAGVAALEITNSVATTTSADPSVDLTTTRTTMSYGAVHSGAAAPPSVPATGCTLQFQNDYGTLSASSLRRTSPDAAGTVTLGYTLGSDDWAMIAIALAEQPIQVAAGSVALALSVTGSALKFTPRTPGLLGDADIVQFNTGSFAPSGGFQDFTVSLSAAAGYGNAVIIAAFTFNGQVVGQPSGVGGLLLTTDSPATSGTARLYVFRRPDVFVAGASSWVLSTGSGVVPVVWVAVEVAGLAVASTVDAVSTYYTDNGFSITPSLPAGLSYDTVQLVVAGVRNSSNTTIPTWDTYTSDFVEVAEKGVVDGTGAIAVGVASKFPRNPAGVTVTATHSAPGTNEAACVISYTAEGARVATSVGGFWGFEQGTFAGATLGASPVFNAFIGTPTVTASTPRTGTWCAEFTATAGVCSATVAAPFGTSKLGAVRVPLRFVGSVPAGDVNLFSLEITSGATLFVRFRAASGKLAVRAESATASGEEVLSDATVTADTWLAVEVQYDTQVLGSYRADWAVDYGNGTLVPQAQATFVQGVAVAVSTLRLGWDVNATATVRMDDVVTVIGAGQYPIRDHKVRPLLADPAGTLTATDTAKFQTMASNGTLSAWNAATALAALDDIPPTIGASADGLVQTTSSATDYVTIPMQTYTVGTTEIIRAAQLIVPGWAASGTAATIGFRAWDGTQEMLLYAAADPNFDNSTTTPTWLALPVRPASGSYTWTQAGLDALELRMGFGNAAVAVGAHAFLVELLVQEAASEAKFGTLAAAHIDPVTRGLLDVTVTPPVGYPTTLHYEEAGVPTDVPVAGGDTWTETVNAPAEPSVNYIAVYPGPEPDPDPEP